MDENLNYLKQSSLITKVEPVVLQSKDKEIFVSDEAWERALSKQEEVLVYRFIYTSNGHSVVGYLVEPKILDKSALPCVIYNRGGNGDYGMITLRLLFGQIANLARQGYIVIATQYSGVEGGEGQDEFGGNDVDDVLNLKQILDDYPPADTNKIGMIGFSRGGMMVYLALGRVNWIKAAVVEGGPTNLFRNEELRPEMISVHKKRFGGSEEELTKRSALFWPEKLSKATPLLIMHGSADERVSVLDAKEMAVKLEAQKVPYELKIFEGGDHGLTQYNKEYHQMIYEWFKKYLI